MHYLRCWIAGLFYCRQVSQLGQLFLMCLRDAASFDHLQHIVLVL